MWGGKSGCTYDVNILILFPISGCQVMSHVSNSQFPLVVYFITHDSASVHVSSIHLLPFAPHTSTPPLSGISRHYPLGDRWSTHAPIPPPVHHRLFWKKMPVGSMVRELKAGCISCDYSITCFGAMFTFVVSNYLCNHRAWFWNVSRTCCIEPRNHRCKKIPVKTTQRQIHKIIKNKKKIMDQLDQPQKDQQTQKRSHPTHHLWDLWVFVGSLWFFDRFSAPMSLLWQVHMFFWLWCSFNGHGMQVLEVWKWGTTSTIFCFNEFRKPPCVMGRTAKGSGFKDLRGILPTCLWPKFHTCIFASTAMSAVEVLRTIAFWKPSRFYPYVGSDLTKDGFWRSHP